MCELDIILQIAEGISIAIPMQIDEIVMTSGTIVHEILQPFETTVVRDGGGSEAGLVGERHHVALVGGDAAGNGHACGAGAVAAEIGFVEGHEGVGAGVEGGLCAGRPFGEELGRVVEEEWDEADCGVGGEGGVGVALIVPVVAP